MDVHHAKLYNRIDSFYTKYALQSLYLTYIRPWVEAHILPATVPYAPKAQMLSKEDLVSALVFFYSDKTIFQKAYATMPPIVQQALADAAWYDRANVPQLEKKYRERVFSHESYYASNFDDIEAPFRLFKPESEYGYYANRSEHRGYLIMPEELRTALRGVLPLPAEAEVQSKPDTVAPFQHNAEAEVLQQVELYYAYIHEGNLAYSQNRLAAPTVPSLRQMQRYCNIHEFYTDASLPFFKTAAIATVFRSADSKCTHDSDYTYVSPLDLLKQVVGTFLDVEHDTPYLSTILSHLKVSGGAFLDDIDLPISKGLHAIFKQVAQREGQWVSVPSLVNFAFFRRIELMPISSFEAARYLYISIKGKYGMEKKYLSDAMLQKQAIMEPLVKGILFSLGALGLFKLAYQPPIHSIPAGEKPYMSPYDGLMDVMMTPLGRYILGFTKEYTAPVYQSDASILLHEHELVASMAGTDKVKQMALEKIASTVSAGVYLVTPESAFRECRSVADVTNKINFFKQTVAVPLPPLWEEFFKQLVSRANPLKEETTSLVYEVKADKDLLTAIARDPHLKEMVLKAEGRRIIVKAERKLQLIYRLRELGYFCENEVKELR